MSMNITSFITTVQIRTQGSERAPWLHTYALSSPGDLKTSQYLPKSQIDIQVVSEQCCVCRL